jgi:hypothetical protein
MFVQTKVLFIISMHDAFQKHSFETTLCMNKDEHGFFHYWAIIKNQVKTDHVLNPNFTMKIIKYHQK